jgi:Uma2 family endonuclease
MIIINEGCTIDHYWRVEARTEYKNKFIEGQIISHIGMGFRHSDIKMNLYTGLRKRESNWRVLAGFRMKVESPGAYLWPDVSVFERPGQFEPCGTGDGETLLNPTLVAEVVTPLTEALDRGAKWRHYQTVPSLREYVLVAHDRVRVERYLRRDDEWLYWSTTDIDAVVDLASVGASIPVRNIYDRVTFPSERKSMLIPPVDVMR